VQHARTSRIWVIAFLCWFGVLYNLSDGPVPIKDGPDIPHLDKLLHFLYFAGGGVGLHLAFHFKSHRELTRPPLSQLLIVTLIIAICGAFDEWHQSWIPERTGNDPFDWLADVMGGIASFWIYRPIAKLLSRTS